MTGGVFYRWRSAITGRWVKAVTALRHPAETVRETIRRHRDG